MPLQGMISNRSLLLMSQPCKALDHSGGTPPGHRLRSDTTTTAPTLLAASYSARSLFAPVLSAANTRLMRQTLRRFFLCWPVLTVAGVCALYLSVGFWGLPALVKWQAKKQVQEKLGHTLTVGEIRFNPLLFQLEVRELALADAQGHALAGFQRLWVDFELWRSLVDSQWTFSEATLQAPQLNVTLLKDGGHNFNALLAQLTSDTAAEPPAPSALPRLVVQHLSMTDAQFDLSDQQLTPPLISRIAPLSVTVDGLSTGAQHTARFSVMAPTTQGESITSDGTLSLNPVAIQGQVALKNIQIHTLARALSRWVTVDTPTGQLAASARFDLSVKDQAGLTGTVQEVALDVTDLSLTAPGGTAPLLALHTLGLAEGHADLGQQRVDFAKFTLDQGQINASTNAQGLLDWTTLVRPRPDTPPEPAAGAPWRVAISKAAVTHVGVQFQDAAQGRRASLDSVALNSALQAEFGPAALNLQLGSTQLALAGVQVERPGQQFKVPTLVLQTNQVSLSQTGEALNLTLHAPRLDAAQGLSLQDTTTGSITLASTSLQADQATLTQASGNTQATVSGTQLALAGLALRQEGQNATLSQGSFQGQALTLNLASGQSALALQQWGSTLSQLHAQRGTESAALEQLTLKGNAVAVQQGTHRPLTAALQATTLASRGTTLQRGDETLTLGRASLTADQLDVTQNQAQLQLKGTATALDWSDLTAQQGKNRLQLASGALTTRQLTLDTTGALQARVSEATLKLGPLSVQARGAPANLGQWTRAALGAQSLQLTLADGPLELTGDGLSAELTQATVNSPADGTELIRLGQAALAGGALRLRQQQFSADTLTVKQGEANTWLDAQGQFNLLRLFSTPRTAPASQDTTPKQATTTAPPPAAAPWRLAVKQSQLEGFTLNFEDRTVQPPMALRLAPLRAQVKGLDTGSSAPLQLALNTTLASGGTIQVDGTVHATTGVADLQLGLTDIALAPVQGYVSQFTELQLTSGTVSSSGRLRYGDPKNAGAALVFKGAMAVNQLLLEETEPQRPFLGWSAVSADELQLTLTPNRLDITELRVEQPSGRLLIAADQSMNITDVLKKTAPATPATPEKTATAAAETATTFPVSIARVRVADGTLEFSDASLRPQFAARMHELQGVITGISNDPSQSAKVQLDARVDQYGSAKIGGQISLLRPETLTEIDMAFRNLELTSLSPYVVKFAGYRIAAGRLWLDLQYRVKDSKLLGENKVVLKQVALGEKVESPNALNLPLELAIAILADSDGVIDIGLPVRGDLNDPQFDYGAVIGKAVGNLLGGIVTAPFRALAALFGGANKTLDTVVFEPGTATLAPPEQQKLVAIARALKERPTLKLVVPPTRSEEFDMPVLKSRAVRRDIVTAMGITLAPGEDPGPVDAANTRTQQAIETVFSTRYAPEVLSALKARARRAAEPVPALPTSAFYQGLLSRLVAEQPVPDAVLAQLATQRSDAILKELTQTLGVSDARASAGPPESAHAADAQSVTLQLQLEVAQ